VRGASLGEGLPLAKRQTGDVTVVNPLCGFAYVVLPEPKLHVVVPSGALRGRSPRRGGSGGPNGGRWGRAAGADISTGVQCPERGGDFPLLICFFYVDGSVRGSEEGDN
jgi:hypothetical protein